MFTPKLTEEEFRRGDKIGIYHNKAPVIGYKKIKCSYTIENEYIKNTKYMTAIAELEIPQDSKILRAREYIDFFDEFTDPNEEVRTNRALVKNIIPSKSIKYDQCSSLYDNNFKYKINTIIAPDWFNKNLDVQQGSGIHFFINKKSAELYNEPCYMNKFKELITPKYQEMVY